MLDLLVRRVSCAGFRARSSTLPHPVTPTGGRLRPASPPDGAASVRSRMTNTSGAPCDLGAVELRRAIGAGELSPVELLSSCLARIDDVDPAVNAFVTVDRDGARSAAVEAERAVRRGDPLGPLHGLPIGIKDLERTEGLRTTFGSPIFADHVPARDDRTVAAVRRAGAIVVAKTNVPEWGAGANTRNPIVGATGNPFDPDLTCGGSSGGSAVALATAMVPLATGTDNGGSLRIPASMCGVVGFRPSPGTVPADTNASAWSPLAVVGPMARTVADVALLLSAQAGFDTCDPMSAPLDASALGDVEPVDLAGVRIGWSADLGIAPLEPVVRAAFVERIASLSDGVGRCEEVTLDLDGAVEVYDALRAEAFCTPQFLDWDRTRPADLGPLVRANIATARTVAFETAVRARVVQTEMFRRASELLLDLDVLMTPVTPVTPFPWRGAYPTEIDGVAMRSYYEWLTLTAAISLLGLPAVSLPWGTDATGMPVGVQVIGPHRGDRATLAVAAALEARFATDPRTARPTPDLGRLTGVIGDFRYDPDA